MPRSSAGTGSIGLRAAILTSEEVVAVAVDVAVADAACFGGGVFWLWLVGRAASLAAAAAAQQQREICAERNPSGGQSSIVGGESNRYTTGTHAHNNKNSSPRRRASFPQR